MQLWRRCSVFVLNPSYPSTAHPFARFYHLGIYFLAILTNFRANGYHSGPNNSTYFIVLLQNEHTYRKNSSKSHKFSEQASKVHITNATETMRPLQPGKHNKIIQNRKKKLVKSLVVATSIDLKVDDVWQGKSEHSTFPSHCFEIDGNAFRISQIVAVERQANNNGIRTKMHFHKSQHIANIQGFVCVLQEKTLTASHRWRTLKTEVAKASTSGIYINVICKLNNVH